MFVSSTGPPFYDMTLSIEVINHFIADIMLGEQPWLNTSIACTYPHPWKETKPRPPTPEIPNDAIQHPVNHYVGYYNHPAFSSIHITQGNSESVLNLHMDQHLNIRLHYNSTDDIFRGELIGLYWFLKDHIFVRFQRSTGSPVMDMLYLPLSGRLDLTVAPAFLRGQAEEQKNWDPPSMSQADLCSTSKAAETWMWLSSLPTLFIPIMVPILMQWLRQNNRN